MDLDIIHHFLSSGLSNPAFSRNRSRDRAGGNSQLFRHIMNCNFTLACTISLFFLHSITFHQNTPLFPHRTPRSVLISFPLSFIIRVYPFCFSPAILSTIFSLFSELFSQISFLPLFRFLKTITPIIPTTRTKLPIKGIMTPVKSKKSPVTTAPEEPFTSVVGIFEASWFFP